MQQKAMKHSEIQNVSACLHFTVCDVSNCSVGEKKTFAVNFLHVFFSIMDEYIFSVLLFGTHICSYSTTEKYCKNGETWA